MANPTVDQIRALEKAHKEEFALLAQANNLLISLQDKLPTMGLVERLAVQTYYGDVAAIAARFLQRQMDLEKAGIPQMHPVFFDKKYQADVNRMVGAINAENQLGFIPLIIWGVILLVGFFSADYIVSQTTTTVEDKQKLIKSTADICTQLKLSPEACQALLTKGVETPPSDGIWGIIKPIALGAALIYGITHIDDIKKMFSKT